MDQHDYDDLSRLTGRVFVNKMKKGNGMDISVPTAKVNTDLINLAYAKFPNDDDRLRKIFRTVIK